MQRRRREERERVGYVSEKLELENGKLCLQLICLVQFSNLSASRRSLLLFWEK